MIINDWVNIWLDTYKKPFVSDNTMELIGYVLKHILGGFDGREAQNINGYELQQFLNGLSSVPNMQDKCRKYIGEIFEYAYRNRIIDFNPMPAVKLKVYHTDNTKALSESERIYLLDTIKGKSCELLYTAYLCTGARKGEIIGNNCLDIDFSHKSVHLFGTKNIYSDRYVPLFDRLNSAIGLVPDYKKYFIKYTEDYAYLQFKRHCERVGLNGFCVRSLRSTFSNLCYEVGVREKTVGAWLGHSGRTTTSRYYIKSDRISSTPQGQILKEIELVNAVL